jgi:hypothetical protein
MLLPQIPCLILNSPTTHPPPPLPQAGARSDDALRPGAVGRNRNRLGPRDAVDFAGDVAPLYVRRLQVRLQGRCPQQLLHGGGGGVGRLQDRVPNEAPLRLQRLRLFHAGEGEEIQVNAMIRRTMIETKIINYQ